METGEYGRVFNHLRTVLRKAASLLWGLMSLLSVLEKLTNGCRNNEKAKAKSAAVQVNEGKEETDE